jgi:hypothetical protein
MAPRLGGEQRWLAVDNDLSLIERQPKALEGTDFECQLSSRQWDLAGNLHSLPLDDCHLVTASALLDLVSASWLQSLAVRCQMTRATVLFALNYDGRMECLPREPNDEWLGNLINRHQQGDKGFGPALGPSATRHACVVFEACGFASRTTASDWLIEPEEQALQRELIAGWTAAAHEIAPLERMRIEQWSRRRTEHVMVGASRILVGHQDFMAWPKAPGE